MIISIHFFKNKIENFWDFHWLDLEGDRLVQLDDCPGQQLTDHYTAKSALCQGKPVMFQLKTVKTES